MKKEDKSKQTVQKSEKPKDEKIVNPEQPQNDKVKVVIGKDGKPKVINPMSSRRQLM